MYFKKHLRFKSLIELTKEEFDRVEDWRGKNKSNGISDVMLSGLVIMDWKNQTIKKYFCFLKDAK